MKNIESSTAAVNFLTVILPVSFLSVMTVYFPPFIIIMSDTDNVNKYIDGEEKQYFSK